MSLLRRISHFIIFHAYVRRRISRTDEVMVSGFKLRVPTTVFHPSLYLTSRYFGRYLATLNFHEMKGLDVGCGSGLLSLVAASKGARMVALDVNPAAVTATLENAATNMLSKQIIPLRSDLFAGLSAMHRNFDFILCNPPYYPGEAADMSGRAWHGGNRYDFLQRLANESAGYLRSGGSIYFILSTDVDVDRILSLFQNAGYHTSVAAQKRYFFETLSIFQATHR